MSINKVSPSFKSIYGINGKDIKTGEQMIAAGLVLEMAKNEQEAMIELINSRVTSTVHIDIPDEKNKEAEMIMQGGNIPFNRIG